jgi:hypothetical protein
MRVGRTEILCCDLCGEPLGPKVWKTEDPDGTIRRFCTEEERAEYCGKPKEGAAARKEVNAIYKVICPACRGRVRTLC